MAYRRSPRLLTEQRGALDGRTTGGGTLEEREILEVILLPPAGR
ncbi:MAG TPA: hypothetical protein VEB59_10160 [Gemmatimonadales bacterium]|nr:hypothetical protein [Gemmatimonadales bacterium]